ncbi:hypothetical protein [Streptomyces rimosus]|uniref:hypothetical protein n=1 Tax=Streptomyces rimosus TaxID=1927 RepID=UPI0037D9811A
MIHNGLPLWVANPTRSSVSDASEGMHGGTQGLLSAQPDLGPAEPPPECGQTEEARHDLGDADATQPADVHLLLYAPAHPWAPTPRLRKLFECWAVTAVLFHVKRGRAPKKQGVPFHVKRHP